jgi:spermidine/putrescine ABC transporter ATP-binding subunit
MSVEKGAREVLIADNKKASGAEGATDAAALAPTAPPQSQTAPPQGAGRTDDHAVVHLEGVSKVYPGADVPAVVDMDLLVREGEFFSILGSSGSGKTTTLRMIAGFEQPTQGCVRLDGKDVTGVPPFRRDVNTVFQNYALFPHMKVKANVAYPLKMRRVDKKETKERVKDALERVSMTGYEDRLPHQLSGGQRQRVALARALVGNPRLLLLDEPLGALDLKLRESMLVVLKHLQRDIGITFVYVTHDQGEALAMSDRLAVMNNGYVEQLATPTELYNSPATSFVAGFIGKTNLLECKRQSARNAIAGQLPLVLADDPGEETFTVSLRPEAVVVGPDSHNLPNHFQARVSDVLFLGHECEVIADAAGQRLMVRTSAARVEPGDMIDLGWEPEAAVVVKETGTWRQQPTLA